MSEKIRVFRKQNKIFSEYIGILFGSIPYAIGVSLFLSPNHLAAGGVTGIAIILHALLGVGVGTMIWFLNIPILLVGLKRFGFRFLCSTIYALICIAIWTNYLETMKPVTKDPILAAIMGGALVALGMGIIFRSHATTGGVDIIVKIIKSRFPYMKTGRLFFYIDLFVLVIAGIVFQSLEASFYAALSVCCTTFVLDMILYGADEAKLIYIISNHPGELANHLLNRLNTGVTYLYGRGGYTNEDKKILMLVTSKKQVLEIEEMVKMLDEDAFMIVTKATEIYGEGYKNIYEEKL